ncbi:MAG: class I SAM-dependent methyltransferase [Bacteroidia bacterium]|nr:class I SAM-dependent methyltransferase [Bacteroidia bacterium]
MSLFKKGIVRFLESRGYTLTKREGSDPDGLPADIAEPAFRNFFKKCTALTYTRPDALYALYSATQYVCRNNIPGDMVECGVWKGGSAMMMALVLLQEGQSHRKLWLYDTYEGMSEPTARDVDFRGADAGALLDSQEKGAEKNVWCYSPMEEVKTNLISTGYPEENLVFVKGKVEDTIPAQRPSGISLLRLDTDWYESTAHEMKHLYPLLAKSGILLLDDYGHWKGAREAVDEYFRKEGVYPLLSRVNYTVRMHQKMS